ncbi:MAG: flagellar FlbD family protein [Myxococcales bacterium]
MVYLNRLDGSELVINADLLLFIEATPDTVVTLTTGARLMVKQSVDEVVERVVLYRRRLRAGPQLVSGGTGAVHPLHTPGEEG